MRQKFSIDELACILCGVLLAILVTLLLIPYEQSEMLRTFTPEHIEMLGMYDSRGQQWAHRVLVGLLSGLGLIIWLFRPFPLSVPVPKPIAACINILNEYSGILLIIFVAVFLTVFFLFYRAHLAGTNLYNIQGQYYALALIPSWRTRAIVMAVTSIAVLALYTAARTPVLLTHQRGIARAIVGLVAAYAALLCALGVALVPDFHGFTPDGFAAVEWHYSGNLGAGDQLATGARLGDVALNAGLLSAILLGILERMFGFLNFGDHIKLVVALQLVLMLATAASLWKWYGRRWHAAVLAFLLVLPWIEPLHAAVLYPNQSAWRFLGLAGSVLALIFAYRGLPQRNAGWLGLVAGLALSWNVETGICISASYVAFLLLRSTSKPTATSLVGVAARFAVGFVAAIAIVIVTVRMGFGYWPSGSAVVQSFPLIGQFSSGYGGLKLARIDPLATLIFVHALFIVVRGMLQWAQGPLSARHACRIALATLIVLWAVYYFKAPHFWNLWSSLFLYGFLLGDLLPLRLVEWARYRRLKMAISFGASAIALIVLPAILYSNALAIRSAQIAARILAKEPACADGKIVSGVCLPSEFADALEHKASSLVAALKSGNAIYLTSNSYMMPLMTQAFQPLRERDPFELTSSNADFDHLVAEITKIYPACLLFDAPNNVFPGSAFHRHFYQRLRSALPANYQHRGTAGDWDLWCRTAGLSNK